MAVEQDQTDLMLFFLALKVFVFEFAYSRSGQIATSKQIVFITTGHSDVHKPFLSIHNTSGFLFCLFVCLFTTWVISLLLWREALTKKRTQLFLCVSVNLTNETCAAHRRKVGHRRHSS